MGMNNTPASDRIHIGFFGRRNAGKSSVLNAVTGQDLAVVSDVKGTTTDPVYKAMELLPLGPVMMIDTPGIDDEGQLGSLRVRKSYQVLNKTDVAVLVMDACHGPAPEDYTLLKKIGEKQIPCMAVCNKADVVGAAGGRPEGFPNRFLSCLSAPIPVRVLRRLRSVWQIWARPRKPAGKSWETCFHRLTWLFWWCPLTRRLPRDA